MKVFLDFEASSLGRKSVPIEVAWVFEDGRSADYLIRPAPGWDDWDRSAEAIHQIDRAALIRCGWAHDIVAATMIDQLTGHDLFASAPSWDGKWLSALLRAAGYPRHSLRLRDTDDAIRETAAAILGGFGPPEQRASALDTLVQSMAVLPPHTARAHRALPDAKEEHQRWLAARDAARHLAMAWPDGRM